MSEISRASDDSNKKLLYQNEESIEKPEKMTYISNDKPIKSDITY